LGLVIEDSEIVGTSQFDCQEGMSSGNYTARRVYVHNCQDGFKAGSNTTIADSYVHDLLRYDKGDGVGTHNDGIQTLGASNVTIRHNTIKLSDTPGANACIQFNNVDGENSAWLIENNLFDGGGFIFNDAPPVANGIVRDNRLTPGNSIVRGGLHDGDDVWTGNYYDHNGAAITGF
jgi:hypothetical protein